MKKGGTIALLIVTAVFIAFTVGFLVGKSTHRNSVTIQTVTETPTPTETNAVDLPLIIETTPYLVNINTAPVSVLETLPGIGPVLAQRIYEYRQTHGPFQDVSEISNVEGIGANKLLDILTLITLED